MLGKENIYIDPDQGEKHSLYKALDIRAEELTSITGAGGKTTCLYRLGKELKDNRVLLTTTTKMKYPEGNEVDNIKVAPQMEEIVLGTGRTFVCGKLSGKGKCTSIAPEILSRWWRKYDYTIVEADGSCGFPLKGYKIDEPCIPAEAACNIGIVTLKGLGFPADERTVFRLERFCEMVGIRKGEIIKEIHLARWIVHPCGMWKGGLGRRILFFNQVESRDEMGRVKDVMGYFPMEFMSETNRIVAGSMRDEKYEVLRK